MKINVAFFEAFGSAGWAALERTRADVPADVRCILDAKRGDIETSAERYAEAILGHLDADGVTVSPYLGEDAVEPFLARRPGTARLRPRPHEQPVGRRFQSLVADGEPIHLHVARWVAERWTDGRVGLVVGRLPTSSRRSARPCRGRDSSCRASARRVATRARRRAADGAWAPGPSTRRAGSPRLVGRGLAGGRRRGGIGARRSIGRRGATLEASPVRAGEIGGS